MKRLLLFLMAAATSCFAATTITDTIYQANGSQLFSGTVSIQCPDITTLGGVPIARSVQVYTISAGALNITLEPNDTAQPSGTTYIVRYIPRTGVSWQKVWYIPTSSSTLKVPDVESAAAFTPNVTVLPAQLSRGGAALGDLLAFNGGSWGRFDGTAPDGYVLTRDSTQPFGLRWGAGGGPGGSSVWGGITGTLSAQTDLASALAAKAALSHTHAASDVTSGIFSMARLASSGTCNSSSFLRGDSTCVAVPATAWGAIGGTLASQTDLATALAAKAALSHTHAATDLVSGVVPTARLGSGTANSTTFLRGDNTWAVGGGANPTVVTFVSQSSVNIVVTGQAAQSSVQCWDSGTGQNIAALFTKSTADLIIATLPGTLSGWCVAITSTGATGPSGGSGPHVFGYSFDGSGTLLSAGATGYLTLPYACAISAWNISVDAGTATVDIWKVGTGTAIPTISNSITASAIPAIATGTSVHSTNRTAWNTSVSINDIVGINLNTVSGASFVNLTVECQ